MDDSFASAMRRALAQTRGGDPAAATRTIQAALGFGPAAGHDHAAEDDDGTVIDGRARRVSPEPAAPQPQPQPKTARQPGGLRMRLGKIVALLRDNARRPAPLDDVPAQAPDRPDGGQLTRHRFAGQTGARDYRLYVPSTAQGQPRGLILLLHGCTQSPEDFVTGTGMIAQAEQARLILVVPEQARAHNPRLCWNWFRPGDQSGTTGEPALLADLAAGVAAAHNVPQGRIFAAGLSAGGAMAAILGAERPDVFAAVGVHSGLPAGAARDVAGALSAMASGARGPGKPIRSRMISFHGTADSTVAPANGRAVMASATGGRGGDTESGMTGRPWRVTRIAAPDHRIAAEHWEVDGLGHAWSGGDPRGSYADPQGPDASAAMVRFFLG